VALAAGLADASALAAGLADASALGDGDASCAMPRSGFTNMAAVQTAIRVLFLIISVFLVFLICLNVPH
jgi:hypothetical protein